MNKRLVLCAVSLLWPLLAGATPQRLEILLHDSEMSPLQAAPLLPLLKQEPQKDAALQKHLGTVRCSAAPRGYRGTWAIRGRRLYLVGLTANPCGPGEPIRLSDIFPGTDSVVFAYWYSGTLAVPYGPYDNSLKLPGYMRTPLTGYRKKLVYTIEQGRVKKREIVDLEPVPSSPADRVIPN